MCCPQKECDIHTRCLQYKPIQWLTNPRTFQIIFYRLVPIMKPMPQDVLTTQTETQTTCGSWKFYLSIKLDQ